METHAQNDQYGSQSTVQTTESSESSECIDVVIPEATYKILNITRKEWLLLRIDENNLDFDEVL